MTIRIFTIGFTRKSAEAFFTALNAKGVKRIVDVRLNNVSQLAGFSKRQDLAYFSRVICKAEYMHLPELAPTQEMLDKFKREGADWTAYERSFLALMVKRNIEDKLDPALMDGACLLCSEKTPHQCHRRLVAEYLQRRWGDVQVEHLG